jgi:heterotetrameric sarcosine oxidase gamma subunit
MAEPVATIAAQPGLPAGTVPLAETLHLSVLPPRAVVLFRLGLRSQESAGEIRIAGRPLPLAVNSWGGDDPIYCRIGPEAWLLVSAQMDAEKLAAAASAGGRRRSHAVADVSDAWVTLALEGPLAAPMLARGCGLDLSEGVFGHGACTRLRFAELPVLLRRVSQERFELWVERPAAAWLYDWLRDAAAALV